MTGNLGVCAGRAAEVELNVGFAGRPSGGANGREKWRATRLNRLNMDSCGGMYVLLCTEEV